MKLKRDEFLYIDTPQISGGEYFTIEIHGENEIVYRGRAKTVREALENARSLREHNEKEKK